DVVVEEREGGVRLFQAGERVLFGVGEVFEEAADVAGRKVAGVALAVEQDQAARPVGVAFAGAGLAETALGDLPNEVEQAGRLGLGSAGLGWRGHEASGEQGDSAESSVRPRTRAGKQKVVRAADFA